MFFRKGKSRFRVAILLALTMIMQTVWPIAPAFAGTGGKSFRIVNEQIVDGTAYLDWEFTLDQDAPVTEYTYQGNFTLDEEVIAELKAGDHTVLGSYHVTTGGALTVNINQELYTNLAVGAEQGEQASAPISGEESLASGETIGVEKSESEGAEEDTNPENVPDLEASTGEGGDPAAQVEVTAEPEEQVEPEDFQDPVEYAVQTLNGTIVLPEAEEKPGFFGKLMRLLGGGEDVTHLLTEKSISVKQKGVKIEDTLDFEEPIAVELKFKVPVIGDGGEEGTYVKHSDTATIPLAKGFSLVSQTTSFELMSNGIKVATLDLIKNVDEEDPLETELIAKLTFDGDEKVFNGEDGWLNVECTFNATLKYAGPGMGESDKDYTVTILDKTYTAHVPQLPVVLSGNKSGARDGQYIDWKVEVTATKGDNPGDMSGYIFSDALSTVGDYVSDTFKIGTWSDEEEKIVAIPANPTYNTTTKVLAYNFPEDTIGTKYIFFRTKIFDDTFYSNGGKTITNIAKVFDGEGIEKFSASFPVSFDVKWIEKVGHRDFTPGTNAGQITWTITANQLGATLHEAVITDALDPMLNWERATFKTTSDGGTTWDVVENKFNSEPEGEKYILGTISTPVQLTITTSVKADEHNIGHTVQTISNVASISWSGREGSIGSGSIDVNIGLNPVKKSVGTGGYNPSTHKIPWKVSVEKSDVSASLRVLDLLVYGSSGFSLDEIDGITPKEDTTATSNSLNDIDIAKFNAIKAHLKPQYNQKYSPNSFQATEASKLEAVVYTLSKGGTAMADLLVVTKEDGDGIEVSSGNKEFTFDTIVTNPDIYMKNGSTDVDNIAVLFSGNSRINEAKATATCNSRMLVKDMLTEGDAVDPAGKKNAAGSEQANGYNYLDHSVVFRLHVNANDIKDLTNDLTIVDGQKLGNVTLTDTLPAGWEFVPISGEEYYLIYEGTKGSGGKVTAGNAPGNTNFLTADFNTTGKAKFTFTTLTKPYVILVKAKPTEAKYKEYFSSNATYTPANTVTLSAANWSPGVSATQQVTISSQILDKKVPTGGGSGVLTWTVEYKPNEIEHTGAFIKDTLPVGLDLRTNAMGELAIGDNITAIELNLQSDGTYSNGEAVILTQGQGGNISYNNTTRVLQFDIPDPAKAYRLTYKTDVTGNPGANLSNKVELSAGTADQSDIVRNYSVVNTDATATMQRSGWIEITKMNGANSQALSGVGFTLFAEDGTTIIRSGTTDTNGKLALRGLPEGSYQLKETTPPGGFDLSDRIYEVVVVKDGDGKVTTTIDGQTGNDSHKVTIYNYQTGTVGDLKIEKFLTGNMAETNKAFNFTLTIEEQANKSYYYDGAGGKESGTITLDGNSKGTFTLKGGEEIIIRNLPKDITYTVEEDDYKSAGYLLTEKTGETGTIEANKTKVATFTNCRHEITGTKVWVGGPSPKPDIQLQLYRNNEALGDPVTLSNGKTTYSWRNLEETYGNGEKYEYRIDEITTPANYGKSISEDGLTVTNTYHSPKTDIVGGKIWVNGSSDRPTIHLQLYRDGETLGAPVELVSGQLSHNWRDMDITDSDGNPYTYTIDEVSVPENYQKTISEDGLMITNTYVSPKIEVTGTKVWMGGPMIKPAIELQLYRNGEEQGEPIELNGSEDEPWTYTWTDLDKTDLHGVDYEYTIDEVSTPPGYIKFISPDGLTITNTYRIGGGGGIPPQPEKPKKPEEKIDNYTGLTIIEDEDGKNKIVGGEGGEKVILREMTPKGPEEKLDVLDPETGELKIEELEKGKDHEFVVTIEVGDQELIVGKLIITVDEDGNVNMQEELIDPYGTINDSETGELLGDVELELFYADTERNKSKGLPPHTRVILPELPGFAPNDNRNPQWSIPETVFNDHPEIQDHGNYAWMVFAETDYYIKGKKVGYQVYTSDIISVEFDIVKHDFTLIPLEPKVGGIVETTTKPGATPTEPGTTEEKPTLPKVGESGNLGIYLLGMLFIAIGLYIGRRRTA